MIRILPDILSNQIAAGEVVQRPASVVKELVENSIDARATRVTVEMDKGGKSLIRVSDDGTGLSRDQALLAIERYATSKIHTKEDLFAIASFGFRGEALPSMASVSKFCLVTRPQDADTATKVEMAGGKLLQVSDTGAPAGTLVEVRHLFFNTPARRKFLKTDTTEGAHITDTLSGLALGNPSVGFRLFSKNRLVKHFPPDQDLVHRAMLVLGQDAADHLYEMDYSAGDVRVTGVCANPAVSRATAGRIYLFVNQRLVRDKGVVAALFRGYAGRIMKGRYPMAVVCCELPCDQVDVNVHPSKREIKFLDARPVYQAVTAAVNTALLAAQQQVSTYTGSRSGPDPRPADLINAPRFAQTPISWAPDPVPADPLIVRESKGFRNDNRFDPMPESDGLHHEVRQTFDRFATPENKSDPPLTAKTPDRSPVPRVVGQVMGTYIVAEQENALMLVDQHAAHERVVYEALKHRQDHLPADSQYLLVPETLELSAKEADLLSGILPDLAAMGLVIEPFGGTTFVIKAVPGLVDQTSVKTLVTGMVDTLMETGDIAVREQWRETCLMSMACHHAIRAHRTLSLTEMQTLIKDLLACDNAFHCPHGRPTIVTFDKVQMEKLFKRVV
ncbi:DNA mismatch repair endonuclease MutL [Desulfotignum phosphitoxidans]|uniref:DNA mismatch repair protein MutL n=1 Tax=Desulfotignum phosphitoxidans DSM 13687 TaxID=1286635 RepID=S0G3A0_9BACT|nr:DNA mismatch repair endonuclease MutL [Desulfotignum phosphitoxidans]EMS78657.1 DNA mismatch repair protein MutL [Desulfotignum phosphitoxidans DSM 13687]